MADWSTPIRPRVMKWPDFEAMSKLLVPERMARCWRDEGARAGDGGCACRNAQLLRR